MKKKLMKPVIISIAAALLLTACGSRQATPDQASGPAAAGQSASGAAAEVVIDQNSTVQVIDAADPSKNPEKAKSRTDTFVAAISAPGGVFLPYFYDNGWDGNATEPIFASLVTLDKEGKPVPSLAENWEVSPDQLKYTFHLRKDLKFSDGSPLTADDVAFTLTLLHDPAYAGYIDITRAFIKGGKAYKEGTADSIEGIKIIDPLTVEITTEKVNSQTLTLLGGAVLPKAYYGSKYQRGKLDYLKDLYPKPLGAGPFVFESYVPDQEIRYVANANYYAGKPKAERLIFKVTTNETKFQLFQAGETDYDGFTPPSNDMVEQLKELGFANIRISTVNSYGFVYINNKKPYLKDKLVRQALIYGLDRQKFVTAKFKEFGRVANVPTSPLSWAYTEEGINKYEFSTEKANGLLDQAGWKPGSDGIREKDGQKLKISYLTRTKDDEFIPIAQENYKELGIELNPEVMDFNALVAKLNDGSYDLAAVSTSILTDPNDAVEEFSSNHPANAAGYSNPNVDRLLLESVSTTDVEKRKAVYKELFKELTDDPPVILLNYRKSIAAYNSRIQGFEIDGYTGITASLPNVSIRP